jgi:hypothetical protein
MPQILETPIRKVENNHKMHRRTSTLFLKKTRTNFGSIALIKYPKGLRKL